MTERRISKPERIWIWGFALLLVAITGLPHLVAALAAPGTFSGFLIGVDDGNSYIAKMLAGANGAWLFRSPYTAQDQAGVLLYLPYLLLGKLLGPGAQHGHLVLLFHTFRSLSLVALCFATYDFLAYFLERVSLRRLGLALATLGSGLGWLLLIFGQPVFLGGLALDFYSPEAFGFLANFTLPHLVLARALLLWALLAYLEGRSSWKTALLWLAMALCQPITAAVGLLVLGAHLAVQWFAAPAQRGVGLRTLAWVLLGLALPMGAFARAVFFDPYTRSWSAQNQILSPSPIAYLLAYGWLLPFIFFGWRRLRNTQASAAKLLAVWLILLPVLVYLPLSLQRRLSEGAWVMLLVLALAAFDSASPALSPAWTRTFALAFPSTLFLCLGVWQTALHSPAPVALPQEYVNAFVQLRQQSQSGEVVLGDYPTGNALPAWAPLRVVAGHGSETPEYSTVSQRVNAFYGSAGLEASLLVDAHVDFVFWGPDEKALGSQGPQQQNRYRLIVDTGDVQVYRVLDADD